jgi:hypothetical protein
MNMLPLGERRYLAAIVCDLYASVYSQSKCNLGYSKPELMLGLRLNEELPYVSRRAALQNSTGRGAARRGRGAGAPHFGKRLNFCLRSWGRNTVWPCVAVGRKSSACHCRLLNFLDQLSFCPDSYRYDDEINRRNQQTKSTDETDEINMLKQDFIVKSKK